MREQERAAARERREEATRIRAMAAERAVDLLFQFLNAEQQAEYRAHRRFTVRRDRKRYVISHGITHNIHQVDESGRVTHNICGYVPGVPEADNMLMQKLLIEENDEAFLKRANVFVSNGGRDLGVGRIMLPALN